MPVATAIAQLRLANGLYADAVEGQMVPGDAPVQQLAARFGAFGDLQVEGIIVLGQSEVALQLQVAQLVRSLDEAWAQVAWLVAPDDENIKLRRAIGLERENLQEHRAKLVYSQTHTNTQTAQHFAELATREAQLAEMIEAHGVEGPPSLRDIMEGLGRSDRYVIYRWDSNAVHSSLTGLGYLVDHTLDEVAELGDDGDVGGRLARIVAAWDIAGDRRR